MPLTQSFPSGSILLVRFPAQSCIVLYGNISQAMGLVAGNGLLRHHKTVLRNRYNRSFGIADVVFPYRRRCNDYPMSACRVVPTPCRRDSNRSVRSPNRRRRQPAARCPNDPSENSAFPFRPTWPLCACYRNPYFRIFGHYLPKNLHNEWIRCRRVHAPQSSSRRKIGAVQAHISFGINHRRQVKKKL